MHIIPVIDVRYGVAVRAVAGDRGTYQPLETPLASTDGMSFRGQAHGSGPISSDRTGLAPIAVALGYRNLHPFSTIYVADLDGIEGRGGNAGLAQSLVGALPDVEVWIDAGRTTLDRNSWATTVIGSESLAAAAAIPPSAVLSLDFRGGDFVGPAGLLQRAELWPSRVIVMTLARVGRGEGPDLDRVADIAKRAPGRQVYAAGGIRDVADLRAARDAGAYGALIASALHAQKIKADDLDEIIGL